MRLKSTSLLAISMCGQVRINVSWPRDGKMCSESMGKTCGPGNRISATLDMIACTFRLPHPPKHVASRLKGCPMYGEGSVTTLQFALFSERLLAPRLDQQVVVVRRDKILLVHSVPAAALQLSEAHHTPLLCQRCPHLLPADKNSLCP